MGTGGVFDDMGDEIQRGPEIVGEN